MKRKILSALLCLCLLLPAFTACTGSWEGYENADLTQYLTLGDYKALEYTKTEINITDEEIEAEINKVRGDNMVKQSLDRPAEKSDYVVIDYTCKVDVGTVSALSGVDQTFAVGSSYTLSDIAGFSDSLIGKKQGESYVFSFTFPEDYKNSKISDISLVAGKEATIEVTIDSLFAYVLPELDDAFVQKVSTTSKTVEEYKAEIRAALTKDAEELAEIKKQEQVWKAAVDGCKILKYPEAELETYRNEMQQYYEDAASYQNYEFEEYIKALYGFTVEKFEEEKQRYAEEQVKNDMILHAISRAENISVSDEEYREGLQSYFETSGSALGIKTVEEYEEYYTKAVIAQSILWDEVIAFLCETAVGVDAPVSEETSAQTGSESVSS